MMKKETKLPAKELRRDDVSTVLSEDAKARKSAFAKRFNNRIRPPQVQISEENGIAMMRHPSDVDRTLHYAGMAECFGTMNNDVVNLLLSDLTDFTGKRNIDSPLDEQTANTALAIMHDIKPQDTVEAMLTVQMIATHRLSLSCLKQLYKKGGLTVEQMNSYLNLGTKLSRTYVAQMEALNRHRGKGQQKMTVEHVHVYEGGQAIVGNVHKGGENEK